jgi:hypothetical protein
VAEPPRRDRTLVQERPQPGIAVGGMIAHASIALINHTRIRWDRPAFELPRLRSKR